MNFETALQLINNAVVALTGRHLNPAEVTILRGTWHGMTYDQMASESQYSLNYLMRDIGPKLWKRLSEAFGEEVGKTNVRIALERRYSKSFARSLSSVESSSQLQTKSRLRNKHVRQTNQTNQLDDRPETAEIQSTKDWGEAPQLSVFYGRTEELKKLKQWTCESGSRIILLSGYSGIGKTALLRKLVEEIKDRFDHVVWRNFSHGLTAKGLVDNLLQSLYYPIYKYKPDRVSQLIDSLRSLRCLLILDGAETIMAPGQLAGRYGKGYKDYGQLLQRLGEASHQSCILISSREKINFVNMFATENSPIRGFILSGFPETEAQEILLAEGLVESEDLQVLIHRYQGNPAALKIVAKLIRELFNGNVSEFLQRNIFIFGELEELVASSFHSLSPLEKEVLSYLTILPPPVSFSNLEQNIYSSISPKKLLEVLASLKGRSLLETSTENGLSLFSGQPMVREYITKQLMQEIGGSFTTEEAKLHQLSPNQEESIELSLSPRKKAVNLSQWVENKFQGWQSLSVLYDTNSHSLATMLRRTFHFRSQNLVKRFKQILLETPEKEQELILLVGIAVETRQKLRVRLQLQPLEVDKMLPDTIQLSLLHSSGKILKSVQSNHGDDFIQLPPFSGVFNEKFSIKIELDSTTIVEYFAI